MVCHDYCNTYRRTNYEHFQVPINVAVEEPRARVICEEPDCNIITGVAHAHDVADDRVNKVVRVITSTSDYVERMTMEVNRMLLERCHDISKMVRLRHRKSARSTHRSTSSTSRNG